MPLLPFGVRQVAFQVAVELTLLAVQVRTAAQLMPTEAEFPCGEAEAVRAVCGVRLPGKAGAQAFGE